MRTMLHGLGACSIAAALAACAATLPATTLPPAPPPLFDGAYRAYVVIDAVGPGIDKSWCVAPGRVTINVVNNRFTLNLTPRLSGAIALAFIVDVAPNGMFQTQASTAIFAGQIVGPSLEGLINGPGCRYSVTATRMGSATDAYPRQTRGERG